MCNAWNHQDGCECGFGPPYDYIKIVRSTFADDTSDPSLAGRFIISIPIADAEKPDVLAAQTALIASLEEALQSIAQKRFGDGAPQLRIKIDELSEGSLIVGFSVLLVGGALLKFFKDYKAVREGMLLFLSDVVACSRHIIKGVKATIKRVKAKRPG